MPRSLDASDVGLAELGPEPATEPPTFVEESTADLPAALAPLAVRMAHGARTPQARMTALVRSLQSGYRYDLEAPVAPSGMDPVLVFLTRTHAGFCQHYASALALLARELGIPTRLVVGYLPGEPWGSGRLVRERDAHSWVEAYLGGRWVPFDPTPPAAPAVPWRPFAIAGVLALWVALGLVHAGRRRATPATRRYLAALRRLRRQGVEVRPDQAPGEILAIVARERPAEAPAWKELTASYEAERFGGPSSGALDGMPGFG